MNGLMAFLFVACARAAMVVGTAIALSKILPRMANKATRFILLFLVCLLLWFTYGYVKHAVGYHTSGSWPVALIVALLWASLLTFWGPEVESTAPPQSRKATNSSPKAFNGFSPQ